MLNLDNITLVAATSINEKETIYALEKSSENINFFDIILFTDKQIIHNKINIENIQKLDLAGYNKFILKDLHQYIKTEYVLICQYDGYILNHSSWDDQYLNYDYVGAPWFDGAVGNGGFSLRSKKLIVETSLLPYEDIPEDVFICKNNKSFLERKGIKFPSFDIANKFSVENKPYTNQFGFHGKLTIHINKKLGIFT